MNGLNEIRQLALEIKQAWDRWQVTADASEMEALGAHIDQTIDTLFSSVSLLAARDTRQRKLEAKINRSLVYLRFALEIKQAWDRWQETADASEMDALGAHIDQTINTLLDAIDDSKGTEK